jgi:ankyrin repeat protein
MDITSCDSRGSTPLHWACYRCSELALIYILAWVKPKDLCLADVDGYTPLHLAVKSAEEFKSCRPIRALLFRGADKTIKDNNNLMPIDIATQTIENENLKNEVVSYLSNNGGFFDCCMLKTPLKKVDKSFKMALYFISLNVLVYALQAVFLYPVWKKVLFMDINIALGAATLVFWVVCVLSSPGFIKKPRQLEFLKLMQLIDHV